MTTIDLLKSAKAHAKKANEIITGPKMTKKVYFTTEPYTEQDREKAEQFLYQLKYTKALLAQWIIDIKENLRNSRFTNYEY